MKPLNTSKERRGTGKPKGKQIPPISLIPEEHLAVPLETAMKQCGLSRATLKANVPVVRCGVGDYVSPKAVNAHIRSRFAGLLVQTLNETRTQLQTPESHLAELEGLNSRLQKLARVVDAEVADLKEKHATQSG